jgi:RimJ/RimL family protein N-acetyltransferase
LEIILKGIIETERLFLRELIKSDEFELSKILSDPESMKYYPAPFSERKVNDWIEWNIENYNKYKHGLWAVILKKGNIFLGDCGITFQEVEGKKVPELGYHINKEYCGNGYATEAAKVCIDYAFTKLDYDRLYTYTKHDNLPSIKVAEKNGMKFVKHFEKEIIGITVNEVLYCIHR